MTTPLTPEQHARVIEALRALIAHQGTKGRVAGTICLHEKTLDNLLAGRFAPPPDVLKRIAQARGISVEMLMNG